MKNIFMPAVCMVSILFSGVVIAAGSISLKTEIKSRSNNSQGAITVSSDSVFIKKHMQNFKNKGKSNDNANLNSIVSKDNVASISNAAISGKALGIDQLKSVKNTKQEKQIIKLSMPNNIPKKVNATPGFIFKDITDRSNKNKTLISNLDNRQAAVERLRHIQLKP